MPSSITAREIEVLLEQCELTKADVDAYVTVAEKEALGELATRIAQALSAILAVAEVK